MEKKIILWTPDLSTGISWQDYQHQEFLKFTNNLFDDFYANKGYVDIQPAVLHLEKYARDHFRIEERYMKLFQFPETEAHLTQHKAFREFVKNMKEIDENSALEGARLCNKLNNWFIEHIRETDQALGRFLEEQGQK